MIHHKLYATQLHAQHFVVEYGIPGEEIKIEWIDFELALEDNKWNAELQNLIGLSNVFKLIQRSITFLYF